MCKLTGKLRSFAGVIALIIFASTALVACGADKSANQAKTAVAQRADVYQQAVDKYPQPSPVNFPIRQALVEFTQRQDLINHPWYIYIMGMNGNTVGYFVGKTYPVNACDFLSSTENPIYHGNDGMALQQAPSLEGIFYGGSGASGGCGVYFFFDQTTDAMQTFDAPFWFASDSPLDLSAPRLNAVGSPVAASPTATP